MTYNTQIEDQTEKRSFGRLQTDKADQKQIGRPDSRILVLAPKVSKLSNLCPAVTFSS